MAIRHQIHPRQNQPARSQLTASEVVALSQDFTRKNEYLDSVLVRVDAYTYYRDMFPVGCLSSNQDPVGTHKPNGLASILIDNDQPGRRYNHFLFDDLVFIDELKDMEFVIVPPVGYSGRRRLSKFAYCFYGLIIDLDDVGIDNLVDLLYQMENKVLPQASYIINSGTGVHVVYLFEEPIPAFPQYFESLAKLKQRLSDMVWNQYTSRDKKKQYQGIFQGYRMVGSPTKISDDCRVTAFRAGNKVTLRYLNDFVEEEYQCEFDDINYTNLAEAKEKWADWYQRRVIEGRPVGDYKLTPEQKERRRKWYEAWKKKLLIGAYDGNRHYCIGVLFNYAMKAEIPIEEAFEDALSMVPVLNRLTTKEGNEFTDWDVYCALVYAERKYIKMGRKGIMRMTKIDIGETKRNGRSQEMHLKIARATRDILNENWREGNGRPQGSGTAEQKVLDWRRAHPDGTKAECIRATGIGAKTVYRWWSTYDKELDAERELNEAITKYSADM